MSLARRKLWDASLSGFLVGNTCARALITEEEGSARGRGEVDDDYGADGDGSAASSGSASSSSSSTAHPRAALPLEILYIGVADLRNPLTTLLNVPPGRPVTLHLNDSCPLALARCVALLLMVAQDSDDGDDDSDDSNDDSTE